jgi:gamma-glutamylputrescine oxidase
MNTSYWERESFLEGFEVLIVGGGIAGLSAAIEFKKQDENRTVAVLERSWLSDGASTKNAGFACFGSVSEFLDDLKDLSFDEVVQLGVRRYNGIQKLVKEYSIECLELEWNGGHEVFFKEDENSFNDCCEQLEKINNAYYSAIGIRPYVVQHINSFQGIENLIGVISNQYEGGLNTGAMLHAMRTRCLELDVHVFNGVEVEGYKSSKNGVQLYSSVGDWKAKQVAFCTSSFHSNLFPSVELNSKRNQVIVTKPIDNLKLNGTFHHQEGFNYFRNINGRILMGGMRHLFPNTETTDVQGNTDELKYALLSFIQTKIHTSSVVEVDMAWSGILGVGKDERAVVEQVEERVFIGVRLGGIGVAIGSLIGEELATLMRSSLPK